MSLDRQCLEDCKETLMDAKEICDSLADPNEFKQCHAAVNSQYENCKQRCNFPRGI